MNVQRVGASAVVSGCAGVRLITFAGDAPSYRNAQLDDYQGRTRRHFAWRPPLRLRVRARFSHAAAHLHGTAGFGFWNDPFLMTGGRWPALPQVLWCFFASPPSDMALAMGVPGWGWKAAVMDAGRLAGVRWLPLAPVVMPALRRAAWQRRLWPRVQRDLGIAEAPLPVAMDVWHDYEIRWGAHTSSIRVDGWPVLDGAPTPRGPLGLVIWIDNQYMVVSPAGRFGHGCLPLPHPQWLEIADLQIEHGDG